MPHAVPDATPITVVAVHGNGCGGVRFDAVAEHVPPDVRLVAPTLPGYGGRRMPPGGTHSLHPYVDDLAEVVEAVSDGPVVLLGHGMGGAIVLHGLSHDRLPPVDGVVLHAPGGPGIAAQWLPHRLRTVEIRDRLRLVLTSRLLRPLVRRVLLPGVDRATATQFLDGYRDCDAFAAMFELVDDDWFASLEPTRGIPAHVLWGADDRLRPTRHRDDFVRLLPGATEIEVEGWGHFPMLVDPADYAVTVAWVARCVLGRHPGPLPLGHGILAGRPGAAARLDAAATAGMPVAPGVIVADVDHANLRLTARQVAAATLGRVVVRLARATTDVGDGPGFRSVVDVDGDEVDDLEQAFAALLAERPDRAPRDLVVQQHVSLS